MTTTYTYASGNLLDNRNTYIYTKYHGDQFIMDWRQNRDAALAQLPAPITSPEASHVRALEEIVTDNVYNTAEIMEALYANVSQHDLDQLSYRLLAELVKRFEVTKRIHNNYSSDWQAIDKAAYNSLRLYVRYGELMQAAYEFTKRLEYLNVFLKVLDTLVALLGKLTPDEEGRLASLLMAEQGFINELSRPPR